MAYNFPGLSGTAPPLTKSPRGVGALLLGLPHRETAPAAPLIGTPLLYYTGKARRWRANQRSKKRKKKGKKEMQGRETKEQKEKEEKKNNKDRERREKHQLIILMESITTITSGYI